MKIAWWQWMPVWRWRVLGSVEDADEVPDRLPRRGAVVVGSASYPKWIAFDCACGRRHRILLNTDPRRRPAWRLAGTHPLSIAPSIDYGGEQRCHYFIRDGKTLWAKDSD
jgi:hypothetical protein